MKGIFLFILLISFSNFTFAQNDASADTAALNKLKHYPNKNSLPVRKPVLNIKPVTIEVTPLDMKVSYWRSWTNFGVNLNQSAFSNNWNSGGVSSIAIGTQFNQKLDYTKDDKNYVSEVILQYGKLRNKGQLERKTNDRIFYDNKVGLKLSASWNFFASLNFESQFDRGYSFSKTIAGEEKRTLISRFMTPGYLTESLGVEYKPGKSFFLRIGTGTARQTFVLDTNIYRTNPKNFGVDRGKRFRNELAFQAVTNVDKDILTNVNLKSRYSLFANYEDLSHIDHRLDVTFTARVNKIIFVSLSGVALYDADTDSKIQASQGLALGLSYRFPIK
ncbi:MAG TPA: DUF3078 domain-containing protein [Sphingobacteriaceae bacterium]|nr:DUF3078 domain-containing protein [Sphingobacteriaceae bacterium]